MTQNSATLTRMSLQHDGSTYEVPLDTLTGEAELAGELWGTHYPGSIDSSFGFLLRYGELIRVVSDEMLGVNLWSFRRVIDDSIVCDDVADAITGGAASATFVAEEGQTFDVSATDLAAACEVAKGEVRELVLGYIDPESGVHFAGCLDKLDDDSDGVADRLVSRDFGLDLGLLGFQRVSITLAR